jgi:hypothetical protein
MFFWLFFSCATFAAVALAVLIWGDHLFGALASLLPRQGNPSLAFMFAAMGIFSALLGLTARKQCALAKAWPVADGHILDSSIGQVEATLTTPAIRGAFKRKLYYTKISYAYEVAGVRYVSDRVSFGVQTWAQVRFFARRGARAYALGAPMAVHYDPENPCAAVLLPKAPGIFLVWTASVIFLALAARAAGWV